jgi:hypothetical protein
MSESEIEIEDRKCSHLGCDADATWKGTTTEKDIDKMKHDVHSKKVAELMKIGTWYYCQKHKDIIGGYCWHMKFEAI